MKKFRVLTLLLVISLCTAFFSACPKKKTSSVTGENDSSDSTTSPPAVTNSPYYEEQFGHLNLSGNEIWIYDLNTSPDIHVNYYDDFNGDALNVALFRRDLMFEEIYGVSFEYFQNSTAGSKAISNPVLSNLYVADIIYGRASGDRLMSLAQSNCLQNLHDSSVFNFDNPWWGNFISRSLTVNDHLFFTSGDILPSFYQSIGCFFYNINKGADNGIDKDDLCDTVKSGDWTWEYLTETSKNAFADVDGNETLVADTDRFGFISYNVYNHTNMFMIGAGLPLCEENEESGDWIVNFDSPNVLDMLDRLKGYMTTYSMGSTGSDGLIKTTFKEGRAVFAEHFTESAFNNLRDMQDDYLMLPVPKLQSEQDNYRCMVNSYVNCFVGILSNCNDDEVCGAILESMAYYGYHEIRPIAYDQFLKSILARDEAAVTLVDLIFDNAYIDYGVIEKFGVSATYPQGVSSMLYSYLKENQPFISAFQANKAAINSDLNKTLDIFFK